jgi:Phosphate-starvation-inducible E family
MGPPESPPMGPPESPRPRARVWVARAFTGVEDVVYIGLGLLLTGSALTLLVTGAINFGRNVVDGKPHIIELLDRGLLILLIVELLYTVQVSFREHALVPEPFLLVGLISVIRRILVLTAEFGELREKTEVGAQFFIIELAVLTVLIVALVVSLVILRKSGASVVAHRA